MKEGAHVVRVSLNSADGKLGDQGIIRRSFTDNGKPFGYTVEWEQDPSTGSPAYLQYVAPVRVASYDDWKASQAQRTPAA